MPAVKNMDSTFFTLDTFSGVATGYGGMPHSFCQDPGHALGCNFVSGFHQIEMFKLKKCSSLSKIQGVVICDHHSIKIINSFKEKQATSMKTGNFQHHPPPTPLKFQLCNVFALYISGTIFVGLVQHVSLRCT